MKRHIRCVCFMTPKETRTRNEATERNCGNKNPVAVVTMMGDYYHSFVREAAVPSFHHHDVPSFRNAISTRHCMLCLKNGRGKWSQEEEA